MLKQPEDLKISRNSSTMMLSKQKLPYIFAMSVLKVRVKLVTAQIVMEIPSYSIERFIKMVHLAIPLKAYMEEKGLVVSYIFLYDTVGQKI